MGTSATGECLRIFGPSPYLPERIDKLGIMLKSLFGIGTLLLLVTAAIALTIDPVWGLLAAAAAVCLGIGYFLNRNQTADDRQKR